MRKRHLLLPLVLAACQPSGPAVVVEPRTSDAVVARGEGLLRQAMIARHNAARAEVGVAPLAWDEGLARNAAGYAREMAASGRFAHAAQPMGPGREGENLFTGTRGAYTYREMVDLWVAERRSFTNRPTPGFSTTGRWEDVAHYTQIVWRDTTAVGCALASSRTADYLVCRYRPAGNVVGQRAF